MTTRSSSGPRGRHAAVLAGLVLAMVGLFGDGAAGHDGSGTITVLAAEPTGADVRYELSVVFTADGHPAADATVTAVVDGSDTLPVTFDPVGEGRYAGTVTFPGPGTWPVRFTAVTPPSFLELSQVVESAAPTTAASTTTVSPTGSSVVDTPDPTDTVVTDVATATSPDELTQPRVAAATTDDDESSSAGTVVFIVVLLVLAGGAGAIALSARRRRGRG